ncbi:MAG: zinc ribbon domain-containing protein [Gammaproteobacteria bacterium]|nr:zinc ribbon domain-containing protein [Gammaproteobacteria bacterium]
MPIYEYKCADCGHQLESIQKISDEPLTDCPECGKPALKRLLSAAGFQLKGSGWYATDFKNSGKSGKKEQKADKKKDESSSSSSSEGGSSAPEKKACGGGGESP